MDGGRIELIIITQHGDQFQRVPGGVGYVDEMIREAGLPAQAPLGDDDEAWLIGCMRTLNRRFGHRVRIRLVNPMSLSGLYLAIRFRFRGYPAVIMPDGRVLVEPALETLVKLLEEDS